jgi:lipopolysaccharide export system protein LptA
MARIRRAGTPALVLCLVAGSAAGQPLDLSHGGPVTVTAAGGIDWDQNAKTVTAHDDARAVRGDVTVTADQLIAHYRKKAGAPDDSTPGATPAAAPVASGPAPPAQPAAPTGVTGAPDDTGSNEIYRLNAEGRVHIYTQTDQGWGDHGVYDMDDAVMVLTGHALKMTTAQDLITARDSLEYWSVKHMAVGRGDATVTSNDGRRIKADTLVAYTVDNSQPGAKPAGGAVPPPPPPKKDDSSKTQDPLESSGKIQRVEAFGHVEVRTATEIVTGDRGVYVPDTGLARVVGHVHVTRGENQLNGAAAIVNMKTGVATMTEAPGARVHGLVVPNEPQAKTTGPEDAKPGASNKSTADKSGTKPSANDDDTKDSQ